MKSQAEWDDRKRERRAERERAQNSQGCPNRKALVIAHFAVDDLIRVPEKKMHLLEKIHSRSILAGFRQLPGKSIQDLQDRYERRRFGDHNAHYP